MNTFPTNSAVERESVTKNGVNVMTRPKDPTDGNPNFLSPMIRFDSNFSIRSIDAIDSYQLTVRDRLAAAPHGLKEFS